MKYPKIIQICLVMCLATGHCQTASAESASAEFKWPAPHTAYTKESTWLESLLASQDKLFAMRDAAYEAHLQSLPEASRAEFMASLVPGEAHQVDMPNCVNQFTRRLVRDFRTEAALDAISREVIRWRLFDERRHSSSLEDLASRYASHLNGSLKKEAEAIRVESLSDLNRVRALFHQHLDNIDLDRQLGLFNAEALKRAIAQFRLKYPVAYKEADIWLNEIDAYAADLAGIREGILQHSPEAIARGKALLDLKREILLSNPALDLREMLWVKRFNFDPTEPPVGLPQNWQGNSSEPVRGYDNSIVRAPARTDAPEHVLKQSGFFLGDVDLHFDAERCAFSMGQEDNSWQVCEMDMEGDGFRVISGKDEASDLDNYDPVYLPGGKIAYVGTSGFQGVPCVGGNDFVGNLHVMDADGRQVRRLCFDQENNWSPTLLANGRVMFTRWEYTDTSHYFSRVLMHMNPDGTDQKAYYGSNSYWPNSIFFARPLPNSPNKFVGVVSGHHGVPRMGELYVFDVSQGRHETSGVVQQIPGYGQPVKNVTKDKLVEGVQRLFLHPYPLTDDVFLVSMRNDASENFSLYLVDTFDNMLRLKSSPAYDLLEPIPVKSVERPPHLVDRTRPEEDEATVFLMDVYTGGGLRNIPRGVVKALRVFRYEYTYRRQSHKFVPGGHNTVGFEGPWDVHIPVGTVPVEADGSAIFKVPANAPLAIQPLDKDGQALQIMRSWMTAQPGEVVSCIGCHENPNDAPPARRVEASLMKPRELTPFHGPARGFAFDREVQPILDRNCISCHAPDSDQKTPLGTPIPDFTYSNPPSQAPENNYSKAYSNLHPYVRRNGSEGDYHLLTPAEFHVDSSELFQILKKGHYGVALQPEEWDKLTTWVDLNVPYWGTWTELGADPKLIERRAEMRKRYAAVTFNPEKIYNPYEPGRIEPRTHAKPELDRSVPPVEKWPFAAQPSAESLSLDLGNGVAIECKKIPAGSFAMGSPNETKQELPVHPVNIQKPFWMASTETTMRQYQQFKADFKNGVYDKHNKDQTSRGYFMNQPDYPAIRVSWADAVAFCEWLSKKSGQTVRLPTEAEWEWACRAGSASAMNYGGFNDDFSAHANLADQMIRGLAVRRNRGPQHDFELKDERFNDGVLHLAKVGTYAPNGFGLHDMHGNVAEWTGSDYAPYPYADDGRNNHDRMKKKVVRGGSWYRRQHRSTSSWRWGYNGWQPVFDVGFRIVVEE